MPVVAWTFNSLGDTTQNPKTKGSYRYLTVLEISNYSLQNTEKLAVIDLIK